MLWSLIVHLILIALLFTFSKANASSEHSQHLSQLTHGYFSYNGLKNHYLRASKNRKRALIIVPGMSEPAAKYWELFKDFKGETHDIYIWDHIGQGLSDYVKKGIHPQKVHIDNYRTYIDSLSAFMDETKTNYQSIDVIAHSMGGHIITYIIHQKPKLVDKAVLNAPMILMKTGNIPTWISQPILSFFYSREDWAPSQGNYKYRSLEKSRVSQSEKRIRDYHQLLTNSPQLQRGGVTAGWILSSFESTRHMSKLKNWKEVKTSILILQAGKDFFVDNRAAKELCSKIKDCHTQLINKAKHEIFMEREDIRKKALELTKAFLQKE